MTIRAIVYLSACIACPPASALADDEALRNNKPRVAQVVTLARLAPRLCEGIVAEDAAIRALMGKAGIADEDIETSGAFEAEDSAVADSFAQSVAADHGRACSEIFDMLGPDAGQLLRRTEIKPMT